jgi:hypothetical protein
MAAVGARGWYPDGPPPATTGGFGEPTCVSCHFASTPDGSGSLELHGLPARYEPGETYELAVELARPDMVAAGFELSARFAAGSERGGQGGSFRVSGDGLAITREAGVDYVHQTLAGSVPEKSGRALWWISWTAPDGELFPVVFHVAANGANGDESPLGDRIYATQESVAPAR